MEFIALLGRILFSSLFIISGFMQFTPSEISLAADQGVPLPTLLVPLSGVLEIIGGLSVLFGYKARYGAWLLVIFLIPVTLVVHQFWESTNAAEAAIQMAMFFKNLALLGAALSITYFGSGPFSLDEE